MSQDEFTKLYKYMQDEFKSTNSRLDETSTKNQVDKLINTVDGLAGLTKDYQQEMLMTANKVDRLEQWILKIAEATGVKLTS